VTGSGDGEIYGVDSAMGRLKGRDKSAKVWYFVAPSTFMGDFMPAYDGLLRFSMGHYSYDSGGSSSPSNWDVIIGTGKFRIGVRDVVKPFNMQGAYEVALNVSTAWVVLSTMAPASNMDIVRECVARIPFTNRLKRLHPSRFCFADVCCLQSWTSLQHHCE